MANLTISVDGDVLRMARVRALEHRTSVNAILRDYLERYAGSGPTAAGLAGFLELAAASHSGSGQAGRAWTRDEIHGRTQLR